MPYFHKVKSLSLAQNELIAKKIADVYGLLCPKYTIVPLSYENPYGDVHVYSEPLDEVGEITKPYFNNESTTLYMIWDSLDAKGFDCEKLMPEVLKMYIFDFILGNQDRSPMNWLIVTDKNDSHIAIFDNEYIFNGSYTPYISADYDEYRFLTSLDKDAVFKNKCDELKSFLKESDDLVQELFEQFFTKITPKVFLDILNEVESDCGIEIVEKERKIKFFNTSYEVYLKILRDYQMERK